MARTREQKKHCGKDATVFVNAKDVEIYRNTKNCRLFLNTKSDHPEIPLVRLGELPIQEVTKD
jgi:hypothetical protein